MGPISLRTVATSSFLSSSVFCNAGFQRDERVNRLAFDRVRITDNCGLRQLSVRYEGRFDFCGSHPVSGYVDNVVNAAGDLIVAVFVSPAAVTGEVFARELREVGVEDPFGIAVYAHHLSRP